MAKLYTGELAHRVANDFAPDPGGYGFMDEFAISRLYRDVEYPRDRRGRERGAAPAW